MKQICTQHKNTSGIKYIIVNQNAKFSPLIFHTEQDRIPYRNSVTTAQRGEWHS